MWTPRAAWRMHRMRRAAAWYWRALAEDARADSYAFTGLGRRARDEFTAQAQHLDRHVRAAQGLHSPRER